MRKQVAKLTVTVWDDNRTTLEGPSNKLLVRQMLCEANKALINQEVEEMQNKIVASKMPPVKKREYLGPRPLVGDN